MSIHTHVQRIKRMKDGASRKLLLSVASTTDSPWSSVAYVKAIEVTGAGPKTVIRIQVRDSERRQMLFEYMHEGPGLKTVNIPRGEIRIRRIRGKEPLTITAHCGP